MLGAAGLSWLATRLGKHRTLMIASTGYSLGLMILNFLPKGALIPAAIIMFSLGFLAAGFVLLGRAMCADVGDAIRLAKGKHQQGLLYAMMTSVEKIASALSIGLTFTILGAGRLQGQGRRAQHARGDPQPRAGLSARPDLLRHARGACYIGYKLDHKRHAEIRAALDERDAMAIAGRRAASRGRRNRHRPPEAPE